MLYLSWWLTIVFIPGHVRRSTLSARERLPDHRAEIQSFQRSYRCYSTGVNPVMVPVGMEPRVVEVYAGFNIWSDPSQGLYWIDGLEPVFRSVETARAYAVTQVTPITEPEGAKSALPFILILGVASMLF